MTPAAADSRRGLMAGVAAYGLWGLFPLYWPLLEPAGAVELLAHRVAWSALVMLLLVLGLGLRARFAATLADRRSRRLLAVASVVITLNWGFFIYGVNSGHVVETSLGYFINPLVTVLAGVVLLGERLRRAQVIAIALAATAVLGLTLDYGRPPWIALVLAFSFATYGVLKKSAGVGAVEGLAIETMFLAPVAVGFLLALGLAGGSQVNDGSAWHLPLVATSGLVTAIPLILFGAAATRVRLSTLGILQYLAPTLQFALGVLVRNEPMTQTRLLGFAVIWVALAIFTIDSLRHHQRSLRLAVQAAPAA